LAPAAAVAPFPPSALPGIPAAMEFFDRSGKSHQGIFFPGQTAAPTIVLAHGYRSNLNDMVTMAIALQENKYNVFVFNFSGHGEQKGMITFGYKETRELLTAVNALAQRTDVDRTRFGVYGVDLGGYAALAAAAGDRRIRAVAVDSVYSSPRDMLKLQVERSGLAELPLMDRLCRWGFIALTVNYRKDPSIGQSLPALAGVAKLFIQSQERPALAESTLQLFLASAGVREQAVVQKSSFYTMSDEEKRAYQLQVINFFLVNLPPVAAGDLPQPSETTQAPAKTAPAKPGKRPS
jgi:pimeloyl-ACP methyl ester carboxylesterase